MAKKKKPEPDLEYEDVERYLRETDPEYKAAMPRAQFDPTLTGPMEDPNYRRFGPSGYSSPPGPSGLAPPAPPAYGSQPYWWMPPERRPGFFDESPPGHPTEKELKAIEELRDVDVGGKGGAESLLDLLSVPTLSIMMSERAPELLDLLSVPTELLIEAKDETKKRLKKGWGRIMDKLSLEDKSDQ